MTKSQVHAMSREEAQHLLDRLQEKMRVHDGTFALLVRAVLPLSLPFSFLP